MLKYESVPRLDGIIAQLLSPENYQSFHQQGTRIVNFSARYPLENVPSYVHHVISDDIAVGREAARHFCSMGLNHFAYFGQDDLFYSTERGKGFFGYLQGVGEGSRKDPIENATYHRWGLGVLSEQRPDDWLQSLPKPLGLLCAQDHYARTMVTKCLALGLAVPDDVSIIGVDHDPILSELSDVRLASVIPNGRAVGQKAVDILVEMIRNGTEGESIRCSIPPIGVHYDESAPRYHAGDREVARALHWLEKHFHEPVAIDEMAKAVGMSRRAIEYRFREELNSSPYQKLLQMRLQHAGKLLRETNQTITEIAFACGFSNQRELCVRFKQKQGMTPTEFRTG